MNIAELLTKKDFVAIQDDISGKIAYIGNFSITTHPEYGQQSKQGMLIEDESGKIWVNLKNHEKVEQEDKGENVLIAPWFNNKKKEWCGIKKGSYEKDGKRNHTLEVTKSANVQIGDKLPELTGEVKEVLDRVKAKMKETGAEVAEVVMPVAGTVVKKETDWDAKEKRSINAMSVSYAKDLVTSGHIKFADLPKVAKALTDLVYGVEVKDEIFNGSPIEFDVDDMNNDQEPAQ